ncbi:phosphoglycerate dehydrogenase, partial [Nocardioides sp. NPDC000441]
AGARLALLHDSVPGVLAELNALLAAEGVNVTGQYLATAGETGFVVTDVTNVPATTLEKITANPHTRWVRAYHA